MEKHVRQNEELPATTQGKPPSDRDDPAVDERCRTAATDRLDKQLRLIRDLEQVNENKIRQLTAYYLNCEEVNHEHPESDSEPAELDS